MIRQQIQAAALLGLALATAPSAFACACCADAGVWSQVRATMSDYEMTVLADMTLADGVIETPGLEASLDLAPTRFNGKTLPLKGAGGEALTFTYSGKFTNFRSDISFATIKDEAAALASPELLHEWRLEGTLTSAGISGVSAKKQKATLILKGIGNLCVEAPNFKTWTLKANAPASEFVAFGTIEAN